MRKEYLVTLALTCAVGGANASLVGRDISGNAVVGSDASSVFLYDNVLNITWLRNANVNDAATWDQAKTWAANLTVGTYSGWRLPTMIAEPGIYFSFSGGDAGYSVRTTNGGTVFSEMASLWYDTLGNKARYNDFSFVAVSGSGLVNTGNFQNLQSTVYWSGLEYAPNPSNAWVFDTTSGAQGNSAKLTSFNALAVRDGDVLATPIPATAWLMLSGIGALGAAARRRKAA